MRAPLNFEVIRPFRSHLSLQVQNSVAHRQMFQFKDSHKILSPNPIDPLVYFFNF